MATLLARKLAGVGAVVCGIYLIWQSCHPEELDLIWHNSSWPITVFGMAMCLGGLIEIVYKKSPFRIFVPQSGEPTPIPILQAALVVTVMLLFLIAIVGVMIVFSAFSAGTISPNSL